MSDPLGLISNAQGLPSDLHLKKARETDPSGGQFKEMLQQELAEVDQLQQDAKEAMEDFAAGRRDDLEGVILATQKADTAFKMLLQVRNKVMDALEEVKQIRV